MSSAITIIICPFPYADQLPPIVPQPPRRFNRPAGKKVLEQFAPGLFASLVLANQARRAVLTFTPGPIVEAVTQLRIYWPLAAAGFALIIAPMRVLKLSVSLSAPKETLPMGQWIILVLSRRYSILPAFTSCTALATSGVTVPALGEGIKPLGPSSLPRRPTTPIMSGLATTTSKSNQFSFWIFSTISISPT